MGAHIMNCRFCGSKLGQVFADLGKSPLANSYLTADDLKQEEQFFPLCAFVCESCFLVQLDEFKTPDKIFKDYAYFSSYSKTWLDHTREFAISAIERFGCDNNSLVIEIASNDGYMLKNFKKAGIQVLGIEPAVNVAKVAQENGIPTINKFFGTNTANELVESGKKADLLIAFNVLPHVPDLNDFVRGLKTLLKPDGTIIIQFSAYMLPLIKNTEFDMIYHEHFSYFSLFAVKKILEFHGLIIFDVKEEMVHGGSLRLYATHTENSSVVVKPSVQRLLEKERGFGLMDLKQYNNFQVRLEKSKNGIRKFFLDIKKRGKKVVGYGAPAKGNTLLNYCNIDRDFIDYTVDISPYKQGLYLPGTHIPIHHPSMIMQTKPDYIVILAWNLKEEIMDQMKDVIKWKVKFVTLIPEVKIHS
jgi:SAM-dependent methyltransferase